MSMEKKVLKIYETPSVEIVNVEVKSQLLAGSTTGNAEGIEDPVPGDDDFDLD